MLKKNIIKIINLILVIVALTISCERDDICAASTATTPRLLIEFYDATNPDELTNVPRLTIYGVGLADNPTATEAATLVFNTSTNTIELPLIIGTQDEETTTRYILERDTNLRLDDDATTTSNIDTIEITYTTKFEYVSRACGYKSTFENLSINIDTTTDTNIWLGNIDVLETTIENENTVHVNIFH